MSVEQRELGTRAVLRLASQGADFMCPHCNERVKFVARHKSWMVICNIYDDGRWVDREVWHEPCYIEGGGPHGPVLEDNR